MLINYINKNYQNIEIANKGICNFIIFELEEEFEIDDEDSWIKI